MNVGKHDLAGFMLRAWPPAERQVLVQELMSGLSLQIRGNKSSRLVRGT